jgi:hypothetical protein
MARKWMQEAFANARGQLHRDLGVPQSRTIPLERLESAAKRPGVVGKRARLALTARRIQARRKRG